MAGCLTDSLLPKNRKFLLAEAALQFEVCRDRLAQRAAGVVFCAVPVSSNRDDAVVPGRR